MCVTFMCDTFMCCRFFSRILFRMSKVFLYSNKKFGSNFFLRIKFFPASLLNSVSMTSASYFLFMWRFSCSRKILFCFYARALSITRVQKKLFQTRKLNRIWQRLDMTKARYSETRSESRLILFFSKLSLALAL